jgi:hypothetical protein
MKKSALLTFFSTVVIITMGATSVKASQQPIELPTANTSILNQNPLASIALSLLPKELQSQIGKIEQDVTKAGKGFSDSLNKNFSTLFPDAEVRKNIVTALGVGGFLDPEAAKKAMPEDSDRHVPTSMNGIIAAQSILGADGQKWSQDMSLFGKNTISNANTSLTKASDLVKATGQGVNDSNTGNQKAQAAGVQSQSSTDTLTEMQNNTTAIVAVSDQLKGLATITGKGNELLGANSEINSQLVGQGAMGIEINRTNLAVNSTTAGNSATSAAVAAATYQDNGQGIRRSLATKTQLRDASTQIQ